LECGPGIISRVEISPRPFRSIYEREDRHTRGRADREYVKMNFGRRISHSKNFRDLPLSTFGNETMRKSSPSRCREYSREGPNFSYKLRLEEETWGALIRAAPRDSRFSASGFIRACAASHRGICSTRKEMRSTINTRDAERDHKLRGQIGTAHGAAACIFYAKYKLLFRRNFPDAGLPLRKTSARARGVIGRE
jgi:hypothetical protein